MKSIFLVLCTSENCVSGWNNGNDDNDAVDNDRRGNDRPKYGPDTHSKCLHAGNSKHKIIIVKTIFQSYFH